MTTSSRLQTPIRAYVQKKLLPALGAAGCDFSLQPTALGVNSQVFFLSIVGMKPLVLKAVGKRDRFRALVACSLHLQQHNVPVPAILHTDEDGGLLLRRGYHVLVEERIVGTTLKEHADSISCIPAVASRFAELHTITRSAWGKIDRAKTGGCFGYLCGKLAEKIADWKRYDSFASNAVDRIIPWAAGRQAAVDGLDRFSLSHGDPNPGNVILTDDGHVFLLDIGHLRYLPRPIDYYTLQVHLCAGDPDKIAALDSAYFEHMQPDDRERFETGRDFFQMYVLVNFVAMLARSRAHAGSDDPYYEDYARFLKMGREMILELL